MLGISSVKESAVVKYRFLFVCLGNICRSPTAEGVMRALVERAGLSDEYALDSAGTHAYHVGRPPDPRSQEAALRRGYDLSALRARCVSTSDFSRFDQILAMDRDNLATLQEACPPGLRHKVRLFLDYAVEFEDDEVPDPYAGGQDGFEHVLDLVEAAANGLLRASQRASR